MTNQHPSTENLLALRDNELSPWRRALLRRHIQNCTLCQQEIDIMNTISHELRADENAPQSTLIADDVVTPDQSTLSPALRDRILSQLPSAPNTDAVKSIPDRPRVTWLEWGGLAAACVVLLSFGVTYFGGNRARENARRATPVEPESRVASGSAENFGSRDSARSLFGSRDVNVAAAPPSYQQRLPSPGAGPAATDSLTSNNFARSQFADGHVRSRNTVNGALTIDGARSQPTQRQLRGAIDAASPSSGAASAGSAGNIAASLPSSLRRVHKEARIGVAVARVEDSGEAVEAMTKSAGGFVLSNALTTGGNGLKSANLSLRVPVGQFETVLSRIAKLGTVKSKNVAGEDITERFSDADQAERVLNSELSVKESMLQAALQREKESQKKKRADSYRVSWQQRADVRQLRIQTAQARARLELLKKVSELSNIEVELNEKPVVPGTAGFTEELGRTSREAFASFAIAVRVPINVLIWILAYAPLWLPLILIYRFATKHYARGATD